VPQRVLQPRDDLGRWATVGGIAVALWRLRQDVRLIASRQLFRGFFGHADPSLGNNDARPRRRRRKGAVMNGFEAVDLPGAGTEPTRTISRQAGCPEVVG
jgi:hypothetical protein